MMESPSQPPPHQIGHPLSISAFRPPTVRRPTAGRLSNTIAVCLAFSVTSVSCFSPSAIRTNAPTRLFAKKSEEGLLEAVALEGVPVGETVVPSKIVAMPLSYQEMVRQMSSAMQAANEQGKNHQILRICLPRDASNQNLGVFSEGLMDVDDNSQDIVLVPPDESWQGGIMQLYYSALPTMTDALRLYTESGTGGVPPRIVEDRSIDESGVDGVAILKAASALESINCFIQPSQETVEDFVDAASQTPGLVVLLNPQWRVTDDWFDGVSKTDEGWFGKVAGFLGGKGDTLRRLAQLDYLNVYNLEGYVCRGWNVRMVKRFDSDYTVYVDAEAGAVGNYKQVGIVAERPTYQEVEKMLDENDFGFRYTEGLI